jgi:biopolymer transport protein ExbD
MFLPSGKPPPADPNAPKPRIHRIVIDEQGRTSIDDQVVELATLRGALERLKTAEPEPSVVVRGADDTDYQHIVNVLDVLQELEITKVGLATRE